MRIATTTSLVVVAVAIFALPVDGASAAQQTDFQVSNASLAGSPVECLRLKQETWANQVEYLCGLQSYNGGYDFFYKLKDGRVMRNCNCDNMKAGTIGPCQVKHLSQKSNKADACFSNDRKDTFAKIYKLFKDIEKCSDPKLSTNKN